MSWYPRSRRTWVASQKRCSSWSEMQSKYTTRVTKNVVKLCRDLLLSAVVLGETNLVSCRHTLDPARQWTAAVGTGDGVPSWADHHLLLLLLRFGCPRGSSTAAKLPVFRFMTSVNSSMDRCSCCGCCDNALLLLLLPSLDNGKNNER